MGDTQDKINCPACNLEMKKVFLPNQNFNVDICIDGCGGIYLDNRELKALDEANEDITPILEAIEGKTFKEVDETKKRTCPVCGHFMVKNYSSHLKNIQIDECYNCGGKFLDHKELTQIRDEFKTEEERIAAFNEYAKDTFGKAIEPSSRPKNNNIFGKIIDKLAK